jgi:ATP-dependent DNA ligase
LLQLVKHIKLDGPLVFEHACKLGAEGIISKRSLTAKILS